MSFIEIYEGDSPVILSMPHTGTKIPDPLKGRYTPTGLALEDTDWNIHALYKDLLPNLTTIRSKVHRYVIDANRDPSGQSLYPGQNTTTLCPLVDFENKPLYKEGATPSPDEIKDRIESYHKPYHDAISEQIIRTKAQYGVAILFDCHSIQSLKPFLFDGHLPNLNLGTNSGESCDPRLQCVATNAIEMAVGFSSVVNGRFKGGWTTRHYGRPEAGVHALQLELAQSCYMSEKSPWTYDPKKADSIRPVLKNLLSALERKSLNLSSSQN